jgi:hypothetical protein
MPLPPVPRLPSRSGGLLGFAYQMLETVALSSSARIVCHVELIPQNIPPAPVGRSYCFICSSWSLPFASFRGRCSSSRRDRHSQKGAGKLQAPNNFIPLSSSCHLSLSLSLYTHHVHTQTRSPYNLLFIIYRSRQVVSGFIVSS